MHPICNSDHDSYKKSNNSKDLLSIGTQEVGQGLI